MGFRKELEIAINRCSEERGSNTPDFILAKYLKDCLSAFDTAVTQRDRWYGVKMKPGRLAEPGPVCSCPSNQKDGPQKGGGLSGEQTGPGAY